MRDLEGDFAFFFVDPMGLRDVPWSALEPIFQRPSSELLVNFASTTAARLVGKWRKNGKTAEGDKLRLDNVFGGDSWIVTVSNAPMRSGELHERLANGYGNRLAAFGNYLQVPAHAIRSAGAMGRPKYHLLFASRSPLAIEIMNGILAGQRERLRLDALAASSRVPEGQMALALNTDSAEDVAKRLQVEQLAASLANDVILKSRPMTIEELFRVSIWSRFGDYRKPLYREAVSLLNQRGMIRVHERRGTGDLLRWSAIIELKDD